MSYFFRKIAILCLGFGFFAESLVAISDSEENFCTALVPYQDPRQVIENSIQRGQDALMGKVIREYYSPDNLPSWLHDIQLIQLPEEISPDILRMLIDLIIDQNKAKSWPGVQNTVTEILALSLINKEFYHSLHAVLNEVSPIDVSPNAKMVCYILGDEEALQYAIQYGKCNLVQELVEMKEYEYRKNPIQLAYYMMQKNRNNTFALAVSCCFGYPDTSIYSGGSVVQMKIAQILIDAARNACPDDATFLEVINKPDGENETLLMRAANKSNIAIVRKICSAMKRVYAYQPEKIIEEVCRFKDGIMPSSALMTSHFVSRTIAQEIISLAKETCENSLVLQVIGLHFVDSIGTISAFSQAVISVRNLPRLQYLLEEALEASQGNFATFVRAIGMYECFKKAFVFKNTRAVQALCNALERICNGDYQLIINEICFPQQHVEGNDHHLLLGSIYRSQFGSREAFQYLDSFVNEIRRRQNQARVEEIE